MTNTTMRWALAACALVLGACQDVTVGDLNNPQEPAFETPTDRSQINALARGLLDQDRLSYAAQLPFNEIIGRDLFRLDPAEPRWVTRLLGTSLSTSDFIGSGIWNNPYRTIRTANLLIDGVENPSPLLQPALSTGEVAATRGFAKTLQALQYLRLIEQRDANGVPIEVTPDAIAPIRCKPAVLTFIAALLDAGAADLRTAGAASFPFTLPAGFAGFEAPDATGSAVDFLGFNRALKARVDMYRGFLPLNAAGNSTATPDQALLTSALAALDASFYTPSFTRPGLDFGIYHTFATGQGETTNPLFDRGVFRANPKVLTEGAEAGDQRVLAKIDTTSQSPVSFQGVSSRYLLRMPASPTDRLALVKNGELAIERALILWGLGRDAEALTIVNGVRSAAGLGPAGALAHQPLLREILKQERYELLFESPLRPVLYRALGILNELGTERGNNPIARFPIPQNENTARSGQIACVQ